VPSAEDSIKPTIPVLVGPTCSGKTAVSIVLADLLNGELISADSRQIFKYLDIGTAKPTLDQRESIKHYFVDELLPDQDFNAGEFGDLGREVISKILRHHKLPIVVGGSGLYVQSLIDGFFDGPGADKEFRNMLEQRVKIEGVEHLLDELRRVDPDAAKSIDPTNPRRIIRALEVYHLTGRPISTLREEGKIRIDFQSALFGLDWQRTILYRRIDERCEQMVAAGFLDEVERLAAMGYDDSFNALNTVGYAEAFAYRRGEISFDEFIRLFKQNSRRYAKRQMTWFKRDKRIEWIDMGEGRSTGSVASEILERFSIRAR